MMQLMKKLRTDQTKRVNTRKGLPDKDIVTQDSGCLCEYSPVRIENSGIISTDKGGFI